MTNTEIILREAVNVGLYTQAQMDEMIANGTIPALHTYASWKQAGYQVKKGSKAVLSCKLWKLAKGKKQEEATEDEEKQNTRFILVNSALFNAEQVEKIQ